MEKIDWTRKLTSRKFWATVCNFIGMLILAFKGSQEVALQITEIVMAGGAVIAYILAEGWIDASYSGVVDYEYEFDPPDVPEEEN